MGKTSNRKMDLHGFLEEHKGKYIQIKKPVKLEHIGALVAQADDTIVFDNIVDYPGFRIVDQLFVNRKAQSAVLGCQPNAVVNRLVEVMRTGPRKLKEVESGSCQDRVFKGDELDLNTLPVPVHTPLDPYPYTAGFAVHRHLDTGKLNQMFPRCGVLSRNEMVTSFVTPTANQILAKYREQETPMPQALVIGAHPAWELACCYSYPHEDFCELELFEAITGQVGEVTRCKTVDLVVPADASIVIEGLVSPTRMAQDGPNPGPNA